MPLLVAITAAAYVNADHETFLFDSVQPSLLAEPAALGVSATLGHWLNRPFEPGQQLTVVTFAVSYSLNQLLGNDGLDVTGFLAFNVLLHGLNACLVYLLIRGLLRQLEPGREPPVWVPAMIALLFAVHPVHTASVAYIIQRRGVLATTFYLLGMLSWLRARRHLFADNAGRGGNIGQGAVFAIGALVFYWLALHSKQMALTLPLAIALIEFAMRARSWSLGRFMGWLGIGAVVAAAAMFGGFWAIGRLDPDGMGLSAYGEPVPWGVGAHFLSMCRVLAHYWKLLILPLPMWSSVDHDFAISTTLGAHAAGVMLLLHVALIVAAVWAVRRGWVLGGLGVLFFYAVQIPYMLLPQWELFVEYKAYLPSVGLALALAQLWQLVRSRVPYGLQMATLAAVSAVLLVATVSRNRVYQNAFVFWDDAAKKAPNKVRPLTGVAEALLDAGLIDEAIGAYQRAVQVAAKDETALGPYGRNAVHHNLGLLLIRTERTREGIAHLQAAAEIDPTNADTLDALGVALLHEGNARAAIEHFERALEADADHPAANLHLANMLIATGDVERAETLYRRAIAAAPSSAAAHSNLAKLLTMTGRLDEAAEHYTHALAIDPALAEAHKNYADFLYRTGNKAEAVEHYRRAVEIEPHYAEACNNLANVLVIEGGMDLEALELYRRAVLDKPDYALARENFADLLVRIGRAEEAVAQYRIVLEQQPDNERVRTKLTAAMSQTQP